LSRKRLHGILVSKGANMPNEAASSDPNSAGKTPDHNKFQIQIDRVHYTVTQQYMTGTELRLVPSTPIGPDRDLFEVVPGGTDKKIENNDTVELREGERFFTAPAHINPGAKRGRVTA
jgi:hypothetical protein